MTWLYLFLALCALHGVSAEEVVSAAFPKICTFLPNTRLVGEDILTRPIRNLPGPGACCDACLNYEGEEGCVAYTFYVRGTATECWLKRRTVVTEYSEEGTSGFPNFFYDEIHPDLSSNLDLLFSGFYDISRTPFRFSLQREMTKWKFQASLVNDVSNNDGLSAGSNFLWPLPASCSTKKMRMNWAYVGQNVIHLPILNLKCPEDCKKACHEHQEESGRYSCRAFNFKFNLPVTECWLKDAPMTRRITYGMVSGTSDRTGFELGDPPVGYLEVRDEYRKLIDEGKKCLDPSLIISI